MGTLHHGEYDVGGWVGLLRYGLADGSWTRFYSGNSPLPGNAVWATAGEDRRVWLATDSGLAEFDAAAGQWHVAYYDVGLSSDTIVYSLITARPTSAITSKALMLATRLGVRRPAEFVAAVRALPADRLACLSDPKWDTSKCWIEALAAPTLAPFLVEALQTDREGLAAQALERLNDPSVIPALRAALSSTSSGYAAAPIALVLARMGDSAGPNWVQRQLRQRPLAPDAGAAIMAAGKLRDRANVPILLAILGSGSAEGGQYAMGALTQYRSIDVWREVAESVQANPAGVEFLLTSLRAYGGHRAVDAPLEDPAFRRISNDIVARALHHPQAHIRTSAAALLVQQRDTTGLAHLIQSLTDAGMGDPLGSLSLLVQVTAVDSVPVPPDANDEQLMQAQAFFRSWWERSSAGFRFPSEREGDAAAARWRDRFSEGRVP